VKIEKKDERFVAIIKTKFLFFQGKEITKNIQYFGQIQLFGQKEGKLLGLKEAKLLI
jgi:hypothetical protein